MSFTCRVYLPRNVYAATCGATLGCGSHIRPAAQHQTEWPVRARDFDNDPGGASSEDGSVSTASTSDADEPATPARKRAKGTLKRPILYYDSQLFDPSQIASATLQILSPGRTKSYNYYPQVFPIHVHCSLHSSRPHGLPEGSLVRKFACYFAFQNPLRSGKEISSTFRGRAGAP
eukprot:8552695-Pyramimonas_sp.AAC.1